MRTKRTFENFKIAVANEAKHYKLFRREGRDFTFPEKYLKMAFDQKVSARQFCNSMAEIT